ncbi:MAG: transcription antitermination factor NusB [Alphaproteobacteria bacterium]
MLDKLPLTIRKTTARLAAIQALYADDIRDQDRNVSKLILDSLASFEKDNLLFESIDSKNNSALIEPDQQFFHKLVTKVIESQSEIDAIIAEYLTEDWNLEKLALLIKSTLRASVCELKYFKEIPPKVIINEYTTIARGFFSESETGFINGILDKIAQNIRNISSPTQPL